MQTSFFYISGYGIFKFTAEDKIVTIFCSCLRKNTFFLWDHYEFIRNKKIEQGTLLNLTNNSVHPDDYHKLKCVKCCENSSIPRRFEKIDSYYEDEDEDADKDQDIWRAKRVLNEMYAEHVEAYKSE